MELDPQALEMTAHEETYEHIGEVKLWIHDLERRWQEEETRKRVFIGAAESVFNFDIPLEVPPQVAWDFVTTPGRRQIWQAPGGVTGVEVTNTKGGRRGVGTTNHCMHGPSAVIEEILDWRPFDYFTDRSVLPGAILTFVRTMEFEPTPTGTIVHMRFEEPKKASDRKMLESLAPGFFDGMTKSVAELDKMTPVAIAELMADRVEPDLPAPKHADGFLQGIQPLQYVG